MKIVKSWYILKHKNYHLKKLNQRQLNLNLIDQILLENSKIKSK